MNQDPCYILLTGIPATGKTTLGKHLASNYGFRHVDLEDGGTLGRFLQAGAVSFEPEVAALLQAGRDTCLTWGFVPDIQLPFVLRLRELGFEWIWLDGDRVAARRIFVERGTVPEHLLDVQLAKIERYVDIDALGPRIVNPFDACGEFRALDAIAREILGIS